MIAPLIVLIHQMRTSFFIVSKVVMTIFFFHYVTQPMFMYIVISYLLCDVTFMYRVLNSQNVSNWYHFGVFLLFETRLQNHESEIMIRYLENSMYFFFCFL